MISRTVRSPDHLSPNTMRVSHRDLDGELHDAVAKIALVLEPQMPRIAAELTSVYREQIPRYAEVPAPDIEENTLATLDIVLQSLIRGQVPGAADFEQIASQARRWAPVIPLDLIARSFQIGARRLVALVQENAQALGIRPRVLVQLQDLAWDWAIISTAVLGDVQREHAVAIARHDASRRADFLRDLASGRMSARRLAEESRLHGLDLDVPYVAVCAECSDAATASALEVKVRSSGATSEHRVLQTVVDGRFLAIAPRRPRAPDGITVAVGPATLLNEAHVSFREARDALATAHAFGITGTVDLSALGALSLVVASDRLAARLASCHFSVLDELGGSASEVEHTVLCLLKHDQSIDETARILHLHRNTVRYRVTRFRELTGLDLRRTEGLMMAWWLLMWRQARPAASTKAGG
jgi:DNA-binding CsgD family transcriptional regulator